MSYIINKTDGSILTELIDGILDQTATDLTLLGKNSNSYGEFINENFIHILENFANTTQPNNPMVGQIWFDKTENRLKVYDGYGFKVTGGTITSAIIPSSIAQGDIWIDSSRQQLYFNDGVSTILAGPIYTSSQGLTGFNVEEIIDTNNISHVVAVLYIERTIIGIISKDYFIPATSIPGFSGEINVGFNASSLTGVKLHAIATKAESLVDSLGNILTSDSFLSTAADSTTSGTISIQNSKPLVLGVSSQTEIQVNNASFSISSNIPDQNFRLNLNSAGTFGTAMIVNANTRRVGIYTDSPTAMLDVNGDAIIQGSLTVKGNLTSINTTNLEITDKLIELSKTSNPSTTTANGSGISVKYDSNNYKTLTWVSSSNSWTSSDNFDLVQTKTYKINGETVLSYDSLGASVTSAIGLTTIGTLSALQVDNININGNIISYQNAQQADGDILLGPKGAGSVSISNKKIIDLANPVNPNDAVNLTTLTNSIKIAPLAIYLSTTGLTVSQIAQYYLSKLYPSSEHVNDTICRAVCNDGGSITVKEYLLANGTWIYQTDL